MSRCTLLLLLLWKVNGRVHTVPVTDVAVSKGKDDDDDDDDRETKSMYKKSRKGKGGKHDIPDDLFVDSKTTSQPTSKSIVEPPSRSPISPMTKTPSMNPGITITMIPTKLPVSTSEESSLNPTIASTISTAPPTTFTLAPTRADAPPTLIVIVPVTIISPTPTPVVTTIRPTTIGYTLQPVVASEEIDCKLSDDGVHGITDAPYQEIIRFAYQVETPITVLEDMTLSDVLMRLEYNMTERLIPALFPRDCIGTEISVRSADTAVVGISAAPTDTIMMDTLCSGMIQSGLCFVIDGQLTVYSSRSSDSLADTAREKIFQEIESGYFNSIDPSITRVGLVAASERGPEKNDADNSIIIPSSGQNSRKPLIGALVGLFGTLALFAVILLRRQWGIRRNSSEAAALTTTPP